jgi:flagellar hook-basal body complex protein FliE
LEDGMVNGVNQLANIGRVADAASQKISGGAAGGTSFADTLRSSINEVARLQQDASRAVEDLATGKRDDVAGVMTAMEKSDLAFKTLLTIRAKLMQAYEEVKTMQV